MKNTRRRGKKRRLIKRLALIFLLLVVVVIGLGFAFRAPLGEKLRTTLDGALAKQGIYVSYGIESFSVLSGLALTDVVIFETEAREETLLTLSNVEIDYHLITLLKNRAESEVIVRMKDSTLSLFEGGDAREITGIDSKFTLGRAMLGIDSLKADFRDITADMTGTVEFAEVENAESTEEEAQPEREDGTSSIDLSPVIAILDKLPNTEEGEIFIEGTIESTREGLSWAATVTGKTVNYSQLQLKNVAIKAESPAPEEIQFSQASFEFQGRRFDASGAFQPTGQRLTLDSLASGIDVKAFLTAIDEELGAKIPVLPSHQLSVKGTVDFAALGKSALDGRIEITEPTSLPAGETNVPIQSASVLFSIVEGKLDVSELDAVVGSGETPLNLAADASMALPMSEGDALTEMTLKSVTIRQSDRELTMDGTLDVANGSLQIKALGSTLDPFAVLKSLGLSETGAPVTFASGPTIEASGRLPFAAPMTGGLTGQMKVDGDITVPLGEGQPPLAFTDLTSAFTLENGAVTLPDLVTQTMGGEVRYSGSITPAEAVSFDGALSVDQVRLEEIMVLAGQSEDRKGNVALTFTGSGSTSLESMNGSGNLKITDAEFVSVPIYAGLRPLLMAINLGTWNGDQQGTELTASYRLDEGTLASEDILLEGEFYEIGSTLGLDFTDRTVQATGAIATTGTTKVLTGLVGKLLEVEASGEFGAVRWKLKNAPGIGDIAGLTGKSTSLITDTLLNATVAKTAINLPGNLLKKIAPGDGEGVVKTILDTPTDAVEAVGGALGNLLPFGKKDEEPKKPSEGGE